MASSPRLFKIGQPGRPALTRGDLVVLVGLSVVIFLLVRLAAAAPSVIQGPSISLSPRVLPVYSGFSVARMLAAYLLSLAFSLVYGRAAARSHRLERVLMPLLDVLQSVPILSFLPVVLLSLSVILPQGIAAELASIFLIFTSQAWNLTYAWYQSLTTLPKELGEASRIFRFDPWMRFKTLELPFAAINLIWNSVMSWAGGWFFLMAAEIFTVGQKDFRLPGLGAYLQEAANRGDTQALWWGAGTLVVIVIALDQLIWRPLLAWSDRFKLEMVENDNPPTSWFYDAVRSSHLLEYLNKNLWAPIAESVDKSIHRRADIRQGAAGGGDNPHRLSLILTVLAAVGLAYGAYLAAATLLRLPLSDWWRVGAGLAATLLRVIIALGVALAWTVPLGVAIGTNRRLAIFLQPLVQVAASIPATAFLPVFVLLLLPLPGGLNLAAILLMLLGTQWYLLFNVIAGAFSIPQDLKYTTTMLRIQGWERWRTLILPALFPYVITGAITATGGAWNASIVAEHVTFGGRSYAVIGIGAVIAGATAAGDYRLLLAGTLSMIFAVVLINRVVWRRLYRLAETQYRLE
jgi:NitT/TauT family transport system permease protein